MGNVPCGDTCIREGWPTERKLLVFKITSISACIVGTAVYERSMEPRNETKYFEIFIPAFITGYIIINASEINAMYIGYSHVFLEICFATIGSLGSGICGFYELYRWIHGSIVQHDVTHEYFDRNQDLIHAIACLVNFWALLLVGIISVMKGRQAQLSY